MIRQLASKDEKKAIPPDTGALEEYENENSGGGVQIMMSNIWLKYRTQYNRVLKGRNMTLATPLRAVQGDILY